MKIYLNCENKQESLEETRLKIERCGVNVESISVCKIEKSDIEWLDEGDRIVEAEVSSVFFTEEGMDKIFRAKLPEYECIDYEI